MFERSKGPSRPGSDTVSATEFNGFLNRTQFQAGSIGLGRECFQIQNTVGVQRRGIYHRVPVRMHVGSILILATLRCYQALLEAPQAAAVATHAWL